MSGRNASVATTRPIEPSLQLDATLLAQPSITNPEGGTALPRPCPFVYPSVPSTVPSTVPSLSLHYPFTIPTTTAIQPSMNATPPIGVTIPKPCGAPSASA